MSKPITAVLFGAGLRGSFAYGPYAMQHPDELEFIAVAEPDPVRRAQFATAHDIPAERQFAFGLDYWLRPSIPIKAAFEANLDGDERLLFTGAYGV